MTIAQFHKRYPNLYPRGILHLFASMGSISEPLTEEDLDFLRRRLFPIWGNADCMRSQLRRKSRPARIRFIETTDYRTAWERWVFSRYFDHDYRTEGPIRVEDLLKHLCTIFHVQSTPETRDRIYRIRKKAQNRRVYLNKKRPDEESSLA